MGSFHAGLTQFVFLDGSVHQFLDNVNIEFYKGHATVNGNEASRESL